MSNSNFEHVGENFYTVRNHEGYEQALNHWAARLYGAAPNPFSSNEVQGFPLTYPSLISITQLHRDNTFIYVTCVGFTEARAAMDRSDQNSYKSL